VGIRSAGGKTLVPAPPTYSCYAEETRKRNGKEGRLKCKSLEGDIKADGPFVV